MTPEHGLFSQFPPTFAAVPQYFIHITVAFLKVSDYKHPTISQMILNAVRWRP